MTTTAVTHDVPTATASLRPRPSIRLALVAIGGALAVLVVADGSPLGRLARLALVLAITAGLVRLAGGGARGRGTAAVTAGVAGVVAGLGIGTPHLSRTGASSETVAGLVALGLGLVLLVAGTVVLVRAARRWWRLLALPIAASVGVLVLFPLVLAVTVTNTPAKALGDATPEDIGFTYTDVAFTTEDGVELSGWFIPSANGAAVVLMHGSGGTLDTVLDQAEVLARHGYGVLLYDSRGNGRSDGRAMGLGWYGDLDTAAAMSALAGMPGVDPDRLGVVGMSMGGEQAIGAAGVDPRIRVVVAEGATGRTGADNEWMPHDAGGLLMRGVWAVADRATDALTGAEPPATLRSSARAMGTRPLLLIAGAGESGAARHIAGGRVSVEVWDLPGTPHTRALDAHPAEWERRVVAFLDDGLGAA